MKLHILPTHYAWLSNKLVPLCEELGLNELPTGRLKDSWRLSCLNSSKYFWFSALFSALNRSVSLIFSLSLELSCRIFSTSTFNNALDWIRGGTSIGDPFHPREAVALVEPQGRMFLIIFAFLFLISSVFVSRVLSVCSIYSKGLLSESSLWDPSSGGAILL